MGDAVCLKENCAFMVRKNRYNRNRKRQQNIIEQKLQQIHILCYQFDEEQRIKNDKYYKQQIIKEKRAQRDDDEKGHQSNKFVTDVKAASPSLDNGKYLKYSEGFKFYY